LLKILKEKETVNVDDLSLLANLPMSKVSAHLLSLEFSGIVRSLPGKIYKLI
jgi:DNA processing protein